MTNDEQVKSPNAEKGLSDFGFRHSFVIRTSSLVITSHSSRN
jgi:hypothetical protein